MYLGIVDFYFILGPRTYIFFPDSSPQTVSRSVPRDLPDKVWRRVASRGDGSESLSHHSAHLTHTMLPPLLLACAAAAFTANVPRVVPRTSASPLRLQSGALQSCAAESGAAQSSGPLSPHRSPLRLVEQRLPLGEPSEYEQVICFLSLLYSPPPPPFSHMSHTRFSHTSRIHRPQELRSLP